MIPIIVGRPSPGVLALQRDLIVALRSPVTVAWSDRGALEGAAAAVVDAGGTSLFVDVEHEPMGQEAIGHQLQVMGPPSFVVVIADADSDGSGEVTGLVRLLLAAIPPSATVVVGPDAVWRAVADAATECELAAPVHCSSADLVGVALELARSARWETV